jgi:hypothetical protein
MREFERDDERFENAGNDLERSSEIYALRERGKLFYCGSILHTALIDCSYVRIIESKSEYKIGERGAIKRTEMGGV